jgi:tetrahydromethanopterin S-methyltransferase subunit G
MNAEQDNRRTVAELPRDAKFLIGLVVGFIIAPVFAVLIMAGFGIS